MAEIIEHELGRDDEDDDGDSIISSSSPLSLLTRYISVKYFQEAVSSCTVAPWGPSFKEPLHTRAPE